VDAEYVYKLWLAHGITTVRDPGCGNGIDWCVSEMRAARPTHHRTADLSLRLLRHGPGEPDHPPEEAREWVRDMKRRGRSA
jgi:hypothetical protein